MQSYASYLLPSLPRCCSCLLCLLSCVGLLKSTTMFLCQLVYCLGFYSLFYTAHILQCMLGQLVSTVHAGIACLTFLTCDWSQLHAGIACLAYDYVNACLDTLFILLHVGIVCLASLTYDWATASWDSLSMLSMLG